MTAEASYRANGYTVLRAALPLALCSDYGQTVIAEYQRLNDAGWRFASSGAMAGHLNLALGPSGRGLLDCLVKAGVPQLIDEVAGTPMALAQAAGNLNLPGSNHQNFHIDGPFAECTVIANVCLVATDNSNGATELVAESHQRELAYWRFRADRWPQRSVRPALNPGDVLLRPSTLWHRGTPNLSQVPRPMAAFVWAPARQVDPLAVERELSRPLTIYGNKFYGRWRRTKEFTAVRLPWLDEAVRLGRSALTVCP